MYTNIHYTTVKEKLEDQSSCEFKDRFLIFKWKFQRTVFGFRKFLISKIFFDSTEPSSY